MVNCLVGGGDIVAMAVCDRRFRVYLSRAQTQIGPRSRFRPVSHRDRCLGKQSRCDIYLADGRAWCVSLSKRDHGTI